MLDKFMQNILTSNNTNTQKNIKENPKPPKDDIFSFPNLLKGNKYTIF